MVNFWKLDLFIVEKKVHNTSFKDTWLPLKKSVSFTTPSLDFFWTNLRLKEAQERWAFYEMVDKYLKYLFFSTYIAEVNGMFLTQFLSNDTVINYNPTVGLSTLRMA